MMPEDVSRRVVVLSIYDYAGAGAAFARAARRCGEQHVTAIRLYAHRFGFTSDLTVFDCLSSSEWKTISQAADPQSRDKVQQAKSNWATMQNLIDNADLVHLVGDFPYDEYLAAGIRLPHNKPMLITVVGSFFRKHMPDSPVSLNTYAIADVSRHMTLRTAAL
jgi:hypothetical protein